MVFHLFTGGSRARLHATDHLRSVQNMQLTKIQFRACLGIDSIIRVLWRVYDTYMWKNIKRRRTNCIFVKKYRVVQKGDGQGGHGVDDGFSLH